MGFDKTSKSRKKAKRQENKKDSDQKLFKKKHDAKQSQGEYQAKE